MKIFANSIISPRDKPFLIVEFSGNETSDELIDEIIYNQNLWNIFSNWQKAQLNEFISGKYIFNENQKYIDSETGFKIFDFKSELIYEWNLQNITIDDLLKRLNNLGVFNYFIL